MDRLTHFPRAEHEQEPILGWRLWRLRRNDAGELRLGPTTPRPDWEPGVALRARCSGAHTRLYMVFNPELEATHRSPEPGCTCGIHAMRDVARLTRSMTRASVVGRVAMWGRVIEHSKGWRAELAYPSRLRLVCWWCRGLRARAEPEVVVDGPELRPACARHARHVAGAAGLDPGRVLAELLDTYGIEVLPDDAAKRPT